MTNAVDLGRKATQQNLPHGAMGWYELCACDISCHTQLLCLIDALAASKSPIRAKFTLG